jgi:hypothetical protein
MEEVVAYFKALCQHMQSVYEKDVISNKIASVSAEIRIKQLPNTSHKHYRLSQLAGHRSIPLIFSLLHRNKPWSATNVITYSYVVLLTITWITAAETLLKTKLISVPSVRKRTIPTELPSL